MKGKAPPSGLVRRATVEVLIAQALLLPASAWILFPAWRWMGGDPAAPLPSLYTIAAQLVACIFIQDTLFYWSHRALHTRWLFRKVHRKHHDFRHVRGLAAEYAHPVEQIVNLITVMTGADRTGGPPRDVRDLDGDPGGGDDRSAQWLRIHHTGEPTRISPPLRRPRLPGLVLRAVGSPDGYRHPLATMATRPAAQLSACRSACRSAYRSAYRSACRSACRSAWWTSAPLTPVP